jgi:uncharacterized protein
MIGKLDNEQIEALLSSNNIGRIGCTDNEQVYIVPINYVYDGNSIIAHSVAGMKIEMMRKNPKVCFQVDQIKDFNNWKSVVAYGEYKELTEERERYEAMKKFVDRTLRLKISETAIPPELSDHRIHPRSPGNIKPVIYRILLTHKTGRYENSSRKT